VWKRRRSNKQKRFKRRKKKERVVAERGSLIKDRSGARQALTGTG